MPENSPQPSETRDIVTREVMITRIIPVREQSICEMGNQAGLGKTLQEECE